MTEAHFNAEPKLDCQVKHLNFDDLTVGKKASFETTVREEDIAGFVGLSGDASPIHLEDSFASVRGFRGRIVHGVLTAAYVSRLIGVYLPGANGLLQTIELQFRQPCYPGMTIRVSGKIVRRIEAVKVVRIKIDVIDVNSGMILSNGIVQSVILDQTSKKPMNEEV